MKSEALRRLAAAALLVVAITLLATLAIPPSRLVAQQPGSASLAGTIPLSGTVPPWLSKAEKLGPADESKPVLITAFLSWRNPAELQQLLRDQTDPGSSRFEQFLAPEQFHAEFSPRPQDVIAVQSALRGFGFHIEFTPDSGLFVRASGTVAQVKEAFHVSQNLYSYRGKTLRAHAEEPSVPAALKDVVTYIAGLDDSRKLMRPLHVSRAQMFAHPSSPSSVSAPQQIQPPPGSGFPPPFPCSNYWGDTRATLKGPGPFSYGNNLPWLPCGYTPQQVQEAYGVNRTHERGRDMRVAITALYASPTLIADVNRYSANHGLPPLTQDNFEELLAPHVNSIPPGDPCNSTGWEVEQTLDVTALHSIAPEAHILFVGGTCDEAAAAEAGVAIEPLYEVIDHHLADIVSNSWIFNNGETDASAGQMLANNAEFIQAALEGISILFGSGDDGDLTMPSGFVNGPDPVASGSWPATSPFVTAVGGTSPLLMNASGEKEEYAWGTWFNFGFQNPLGNPSWTSVTVQGYPSSLVWVGGSSGGPSLSQPEPFYQLGVVPEVLATQTVTATGKIVPLNPPKRVTPDISMFADPWVGFLVGETFLISFPPVDPGCTATSATTEYCEEIYGGTSLASPLFAGVLALVNEARFAHDRGPVGFVNPALYRLRVRRHGAEDTPIIDVNAPTKPIGELWGIGFNGFLAFFAIDSNLNSSGKVVENVDSSLLSRPGYDSATGLGAPNVPPLIRALSHDREK
jgi:subtilase family serine protease